MAFDRRRASGTVGATGSLTLPLASDFAEIVGFRALATGDVLARIGIVDANGRALYADAADRDYVSATVDITIGQDVTAAAGGTVALLPVDNTGAAMTISLGTAQPARSPLTVNWTNGTAGDTLTIDVYYRYPLWFTSTAFNIANPAATTTSVVNLRSKYAQVVAARCFVTTDATTQLRLTDADSRIFFLDASRDYNPAVELIFAQDDTLTGLTTLALDASGTAATATSGFVAPVVRSPISVAIIGNATADDPCTVGLYYRTA